MDFPLQLKFFKKLEFFQTLKRLDRQFDQMLIKPGNAKPTWELEKKLLRWTYLGHKHLGTPLDPERFDKKRAQSNKEVKRDIEDIGATIEEVASGRNTYALQNLVIRGFATLASKRSYHLYKNGNEDLTVEKGVYDGIQGESKAGGAPQDVKGGIYLTEEGLIMGELLAEISYLKKIPNSDLYHKNYNADFKLTYYKTVYSYFELLVWTAWSIIFSSLIIIAGQAAELVGKPDVLLQRTPTFVKTAIQFLVILPPVLFISALLAQIAHYIENDC